MIEIRKNDVTAIEVLITDEEGQPFDLTESTIQVIANGLGGAFVFDEDITEVDLENGEFVVLLDNMTKEMPLGRYVFEIYVSDGSQGSTVIYDDLVIRGSVI